MTYTTILFDIDGTLCDPGDSIIESARYALARLGIDEQDPTRLRRFVGPPLEHAFRDYYDLDEATIEKGVALFRTKMRNDAPQLYKAYNGIPELLEDLSRAGKTLAVVTSKEESLAKLVLESTGIINYFPVISAQRSGEAVKKAVVLQRALDSLTISANSSIVMIGDRSHDIEAANAHGVDSIGILHGYGSRDELMKEGATYIAKDASELRTLIGG